MASKVAIVGLGMAVTPHAKSLLDLKDRAQVAYVYSPSKERRTSFAAKFPFPQCERLETILEDRSVQAVAVLTPPNTHLEIVERCAAAGKHVLLEKPLEISTARAERMVASCKNVTLGVVLQNRHKPATKRLVQALAGQPDQHVERMDTLREQHAAAVARFRAAPGLVVVALRAPQLDVGGGSHQAAKLAAGERLHQPLRRRLMAVLQHHAERDVLA